jgi:hypothetical protein
MKWGKAFAPRFKKKRTTIAMGQSFCPTFQKKRTTIANR